MWACGDEMSPDVTCDAQHTAARSPHTRTPQPHNHTLKQSHRHRQSMLQCVGANSPSMHSMPCA
eukprot:2992490-Prymnesium_polylepis.1